MPTELIPAIGTDGRSHIVLRKTPGFPARNVRPADSMPSYSLATGEELTPTGEPQTFRTLDGALTVTIITESLA